MTSLSFTPHTFTPLGSVKDPTCYGMAKQPPSTQSHISHTRKGTASVTSGLKASNQEVLRSYHVTQGYENVFSLPQLIWYRALSPLSVPAHLKPPALPTLS